jgi:hypothetical protein
VLAHVARPLTWTGSCDLCDIRLRLEHACVAVQALEAALGDVLPRENPGTWLSDRMPSAGKCVHVASFLLSCRTDAILPKIIEWTCIHIGGRAHLDVHSCELLCGHACRAVPCRAFPDGPPHSGSKWPKVSLGCLRDSARLTPTQFAQLMQLCKEQNEATLTGLPATHRVTCQLCGLHST